MQFLEADAKTDEVGSLALPDPGLSGAIVEIPQRLGNVKRMPGLEADRVVGDPSGPYQDCRNDGGNTPALFPGHSRIRFDPCSRTGCTA